MTPECFFDLFLKELEERKEMQGYYKFLAGSRSSFYFRKNYFLERLRYISSNIIEPIDGDLRHSKKVWDCGSGDGSSGLFLAMNGMRVHGTTLGASHFAIANQRHDYWNQYGDSRLFTCSYENLFDNPPTSDSYDIILVQDTLHHLEPINDALKIFHAALKKNGKIVAIEENGSNIIQNMRYYKFRGSKRIISRWDEKLQKTILVGNENTRSLQSWQKLFERNGCIIKSDSVEYIRYYLPCCYNSRNAEKLLQKEIEIQNNSRVRKNFFFFGLNFVGERSDDKI
jgi:SAM-dependent methyltransferase